MWTLILPWIFTHNNNWTCKHPYWTNLLQWYTLVNALYKITTKSIKLLMFGQFGTSSNLIVPTRSVQKATFFFLFLHILVKNFMDSTEMPLRIFQLRIHNEVWNYSIYVACSTCNTSFGVAAEISIFICHAPILFMVVLFPQNLCGFKNLCFPPLWLTSVHFLSLWGSFVCYVYTLVCLSDASLLSLVQNTLIGNIWWQLMLSGN